MVPSFTQLEVIFIMTHRKFTNTKSHNMRPGLMLCEENKGTFSSFSLPPFLLFSLLFPSPFPPSFLPSFSCLHSFLRSFVLLFPLMYLYTHLPCWIYFYIFKDLLHLRCGPENVENADFLSLFPLFLFQAALYILICLSQHRIKILVGVGLLTGSVCRAGDSWS